LSARITGAGRGGAGERIDGAEIHSLHEAELAPVSRSLLKPSEEARSLPPSTELQNAVAPLTEILGARLTTDSPAWSGDPVPAMRLLQKTLVAASLLLEDGRRADLMSAIELVEQAVQMRLRWQQMRRSDAEAPIEPEPEEALCEQS
jgi:hypothetical protein